MIKKIETDVDRLVFFFGNEKHVSINVAKIDFFFHFGNQNLSI